MKCKTDGALYRSGIAVWQKEKEKKRRRRRRRREMAAGDICWGGGFALRWAGTGLCRCYGTACFRLLNLGYRYGWEGMGELASVLSTWRAVNRRVTERRS